MFGTFTADNSILKAKIVEVYLMKFYVHTEIIVDKLSIQLEI